jgi:hypothetical protein
MKGRKRATTMPTMKMKRSYKLGDRFQLSADALDNYGQKYAGQTFTVKGVYDHYVPASQMQGDPTGSPGFDPNGGSPLYGSELPFDVYEWEMVKA